MHLWWKCCPSRLPFEVVWLDHLGERRKRKVHKGGKGHALIKYKAWLHAIVRILQPNEWAKKGERAKILAGFAHTKQYNKSRKVKEKYRNGKCCSDREPSHIVNRRGEASNWRWSKKQPWYKTDALAKRVVPRNMKKKRTGCLKYTTPTANVAQTRCLRSGLDLGVILTVNV